MWAFIISLALIFDPALRWKRSNEREVSILNPVVKRPNVNRSNSIIFTDKNNGKSYSVLCRSLHIDIGDDFCDWYDGENSEHKISSIQKISIIYLYSSLYKNRNIKKHSLVSKIEFLDKNNNIQHLVFNKEFINEEIKHHIIGAWWLIITLSVVFFPPVFEKIFSGGNKERLKKDRNYEQLIALREIAIFIIIIVILLFLTSEIINLIF